MSVGWGRAAARLQRESDRRQDRREDKRARRTHATQKWTAPSLSQLDERNRPARAALSLAATATGLVSGSIGALLCASLLLT